MILVHSANGPRLTPTPVARDASAFSYVPQSVAPKASLEAKLARRGPILAAALAVVAASLVVYRRRLQRARHLSQSAATARWRAKAVRLTPAGETG
jgi:hypothetical protein